VKLPSYLLTVPTIKITNTAFSELASAVTETTNTVSSFMKLLIRLLEEALEEAPTGHKSWRQDH